MKQLLYFFSLVIITINAYAGTETNIGYADVIITNNTNERIEIKTSLLTQDTNFMQHRDWDETAQFISPYETKKVMWFSRNINVKEVDYRFDIFASNPKFKNDDIVITFVEHGKKVYGSDIYTNLKLPDKITQRIFNPVQFEKLKGKFWDTKHSVYAREYQPLGNVFNSYHFVINQHTKHTYSTTRANQLSILTYNTQLMPIYGVVVGDLNNPKTRAADIPKHITKFDVVILQELYDKEFREIVCAGMLQYYPYQTAPIGNNTAKPLSSGVIIFSKWPIIKTDHMLYSLSHGIDIFAAKGAMYIAIDKLGKRYHIIGTHTQSADLAIDVQIRKVQLQELVNFINTLNIPANEPLLFGGDFNIDEFSTEIKTLTDALQVNVLSNIGFKYSFDNKINTMNVSKNERNRIDYVFYSNIHAKPKFAFNNVYIYRDLNNEKMWPKFDLSDHFPVSSYFEF